MKRRDLIAGILATLGEPAIAQVHSVFPLDIRFYGQLAAHEGAPGYEAWADLRSKQFVPEVYVDGVLQMYCIQVDTYAGTAVVLVRKPDDSTFELAWVPAEEEGKPAVLDLVRKTVRGKVDVRLIERKPPLIDLRSGVQV